MRHIAAGSMTSADGEVPAADTADQAAAQEAATTAEGLVGSPDPDAQPGMGKKTKLGSVSGAMPKAHMFPASPGLHVDKCLYSHASDHS